MLMVHNLLWIQGHHFKLSINHGAPYNNLTYNLITFIICEKQRNLQKITILYILIIIYFLISGTST